MRLKDKIAGLCECIKDARRSLDDPAYPVADKAGTQSMMKEAELQYLRLLNREEEKLGLMEDELERKSSWVSVEAGLRCNELVNLIDKLRVELYSKTVEVRP